MPLDMLDHDEPAHDECELQIQSLFTPAMLADVLNLPVSTIRKWHKRGLIRPVREIRRLPYFDFSEVTAARQLAELVAGGMKTSDVEKRLADWQRNMPHVERPLSQLSLIAAGKRLLVRREEGLAEPSGQLYFDFAEVSPFAQSTEESTHDERPAALQIGIIDAATPPEVLAEMAAEMEDLGELAAAADLYRAIMAATGPQPEVCFALAEVLYQQGDLAAARERYAMAVELDENYVEARANLGCILAELGDTELAIAAFQGALGYHPDYADVYFHLARTLGESGQPNEARPHWERFLKLAPDSPWAAEAKRQLAK